MSTRGRRLLDAGFAVYQRKSSVTWLEDYIPGVTSLEYVSVSSSDIEAGWLERTGAKVATHTANLDDRWLINEDHFRKTFKPEPIMSQGVMGLYERKLSVALLRPHTPGDVLESGTAISQADIDDGWLDIPGSFVSVDMYDLTKSWFVNMAYFLATFYKDPIIG